MIKPRVDKVWKNGAVVGTVAVSQETGAPSLDDLPLLDEDGNPVETTLKRQSGRAEEGVIKSFSDAVARGMERNEH